ncbi:hypothetical protein NSQ26_13660 [Bacillus sp. FSL W7-1360]
MKKHVLTLLSISIASTLTLAACGGDKPTDAEPEENKQEEKSESKDATKETADKWEQQVGDTNEDGTIRLLARNDTTDAVETGPVKLNFSQVTVSEVLEWPEEMADMYDFEPTGVIQIDVETENTSEETIQFFISQAKITTDTGEQLETDMLASDHIDAEFIGAVKKDGSLRYLLKSSNPSEVTSIRILVEDPKDENMTSIGDSIDVTISF